MPDHGVRLPAYMSAAALPWGILGDTPYGWQGTPPYRADDLPSNQYFPADQFAYERVDWHTFVQQVKQIPASTLNGKSADPRAFSNPPFLGAGQMLSGNIPDWMQRHAPGAKGIARILRGYIRRTNYDVSDANSFTRLQFMWNPSEITRQYVAWMDTPLTDPGDLGHIQGDNPAGLPPAAMSQLGLVLYFDRQAEVSAMADHPGVMVDLQAFDSLAGNVVSAGTRKQASPDSPDNLVPGHALPPVTSGITGTTSDTSTTTNNLIMPVHITVVLSSALAFEGVLQSASVTFTKFTSRMVPVAMTLELSMWLYNVGKENPPGATDSNSQWNSVTTPSTTTSINPATYNPAAGFKPVAGDPATLQANRLGGQAAVQWGMKWSNETASDHMAYVPKINLPGGGHIWADGHRNDGPPCNDAHPFYADCSSFIWRCYKFVGWDTMLMNGPQFDCGKGLPSTITWNAAIALGASNNPRGPTTFLKPPYSGVWLMQDCVAARQNNYAVARDITEGTSGDASGSGHFAPGDVFVRPNTNNDGQNSNGHIVMIAGVAPGFTKPVLDKSSVQIIQCTPSHGVHVSNAIPKDLWDQYEIWGQPNPFH